MTMEKSTFRVTFFLIITIPLASCGGGIGEALLAKKVWDEIPQSKKKALLQKNPFKQQTADIKSGAIPIPDPNAKKLQSLLLSYNCNVGVADGFFGKRSSQGLRDFESANPSFSYSTEANFGEIADNIELGEWEYCATGVS